MAKIKRLLSDFSEFEDEIVSLLTKTREAVPIAFALFFDDDLPSRTLVEFFRQFSNDEELISLTVAAIEFDIVSFKGENLSLVIPK